MGKFPFTPSDMKSKEMSDMKKGKRLFVLLWGTAIMAGTLAAEVKLKIDPATNLKLDFAARGYYLNDQRIQWSGLEAGCGAEAALKTVVTRDLEWGQLRAEGLLFFNQPWGKNQLRDDLRSAYTANFRVEPFALSELNVQLETGAFTFTVGKRETPFGRSYFPHALNNLAFDSPFIRSEAVLWRETGFIFSMRQGILELDVALVNGEEERDTNSSIAPIVRIGCGGENWAIGFSGKKHDGIGSEQQKEFKNHFGADFMFRSGGLQISGEAIYDEYGYKHAIDPASIFWPRSLYGRDVNKGLDTPAIGRGGYLNVGYTVGNWQANLNVGEYRPEELGDPYHDKLTRRAIATLSTEPARGLRMTAVLIAENERPHESWMQGARPIAGLFIFQYSL